MLPPKWLCRVHLLREHRDLHQYRHKFAHQYRIERVRGKIEPAAMRTRHEQLVAEIEARGYQHSTPYRQPGIAYLPDEDRYQQVDRGKAAAELRALCDECRKRMQRVKQAQRRAKKESAPADQQQQ
jgi:hypothetical protein